MAIQHVALVRPPNVVHGLTFAASNGAPPLALAYLAAVLKRRGRPVRVIDAFGEAMDCFTPIGDTPFSANGLSTEEILARIPRCPALVGVSCMFSNEWLCHRRVLNSIARQFPGVPLIVGGEHATAAAEYVMSSCPGVTACVLGEGEETLLELLDAIEQGRPLAAVPGLCLRGPDGTFVRTGARTRVKNLDTLPWPAWEEIPIERYLASGVGYGVVRGRNIPLLASRGCPYKCAFCSNRQMWGKLWNIRSPADVVAEMKHYVKQYRAESFSFYDLTTVIRRDWILEFTNLLIAERLDKPWQMPSGTRSESLDAEVVANLKKSGCVGLVYAPESGSQETLKRIHKNVNLTKMTASMRACVKTRLPAQAHLVLGMPGETPRDIAKTFVFLTRMAWLGIHEVAVYPFVPYPGSEFHEQLRATKRFPPEGNEYDLFLAQNCNNNYFGIRSWNEHLSDRQLKLLCSAAMLLFFGLQYLFRPWRLAASFARVASSRPTTLLERILDTFLSRRRRMFASRIGHGRPRARWRLAPFHRASDTSARGRVAR